MFASLYFYSFPNPPPPLPHFHCWIIGNWACVKVTILNTISTVQVTLAYPDFSSTRFRIHSVFKNFHSGERIQKVADSYAGFTRYVWTKAKSGKKKQRIKKYPDTYGRGLNHTQAALEPLWGRADTRYVGFWISCFYNGILRSIHFCFETIYPFYDDLIYLLTSIKIYDSLEYKCLSD